MKVNAVSQSDVGRFYSWTESNYGGKVINKCMSALKAFFNFLIDVEGIEMKNPFQSYQSKYTGGAKNESLTKDEFDAIYSAVGIAAPFMKLGGKGERKNMYKSYLKDGFKLFLLTGGRREEVVNLRWNHIFITSNGVEFFKIENLKVNRLTKKDEIYKFIPINSDLMEFLVEMGYHDKKHTSEYILMPERQISYKTIMNNLSKGFTHYKKQAGIHKEISLKNLRKTYISWVNKILKKDTGKLTSHSTYKVLEDHYLDPTLVNMIEKGAEEIRIFNKYTSLHDLTPQIEVC